MSLRETARRHPRATDATVVMLVAAACAAVLSGRTGATVSGGTPLQWASALLVPVPLYWRRRHPVPVFWSVVTLMFAAGMAGGTSPADLFVPLVALHAVARYGPARHFWPTVAGALVPGFVGRADGSTFWAALAAVSAVTLATALFGVNQRTRQAYLAELEERARRLERERDQQARLAVAGERARIAREMHDLVAHHLTVMVALAEGAAATVPAAPGRAAEVMTQVSASGRVALGEMRRLVGLLRGGAEDGREPQPGLADIDALIGQVRSAGLRVTLVREGAPGAWGPGAGLVVYRIVQEALTNTLKHAGPQATAEVRLRYAADAAEISVVDDGAGRAAHAPDPADRHGLTGMAERAGSYGGVVEAGPRGGPGWRVHARLPFPAEVVPA